MQSIGEILEEVGRTEGCLVHAPRGVPMVRAGEALGADVEEFYRCCGGVSLFADRDYGVEFAAPHSFARANIEIVGKEVRDDLTDSWYVIARAGSGEALTVDCHPTRAGRCYDSFWDSHGVPGSCPVIALSLRELLRRLLDARGNYWYWLRDDWQAYGDAYAVDLAEPRPV
jgi:hypothetical protein